MQSTEFVVIHSKHLAYDITTVTIDCLRTYDGIYNNCQYLEKNFQYAIPTSMSTSMMITMISNSLFSIVLKGAGEVS